jgi:predicted metal-binding membrane protein
MEQTARRSLCANILCRWTGVCKTGHPMDKRAESTLALMARRPRWAIGVLVLALGGWVFLAYMTIEMSHPFAQLAMPRSSNWSAANLLVISLMWAVMMAAMMLPSALPMILTFVDLSERSGERMRGLGFVAAYLAIWLAFSAAATGAQWVFQAMDWIDSMIVSTSALLTGVLLLIAGVYQFSPLKRMCLAGCQSPLSFLLGRWHPGIYGAFAMGVRHGVLCVGCCWALMALLFVGGAMNLAWVAALSIGVALEKMLPGGQRLSAVLGTATIALGLVKVVALWIP